VVLAVAAVTRILFVVWTWTGYNVHERMGMSERDIVAGSVLAAGYGYVTGEGAAHAWLQDVYHDVAAGREAKAPSAAPEEVRSGLRPEFIHPPGFPFFVAAMIRWFGWRPDGPIEAVGVILDTAVAGFVMLIAARAFGRRCGVLAGMAYALFPPVAYLAGASKAVDGWMGFFVAGGLLAILDAALAPETRRRVGSSLAAGAILGIGGWLRPDYILTPLALFVPLWMMTRRLRTAALIAGLALGSTLLILLPWAARNHRVSGQWIFTATGVGGTLVSGLGEYSNPWGLGATDEDRMREASALGFASPWLPEADRQFREVYWRSIRERPAAYAWTVIRKLPFAVATPYTWGYKNPARTRTFEQAIVEEGKDRYAVAMESPRYVVAAYWDRGLMSAFSFLCTVCAAMMLWWERARLGLALLVLGPHLYSIAVHLMSLMEDRFLVPSVFCWLIALAYVVDRLRPAPAADAVSPVRAEVIA
jgi:hypothetical protein